MSERVIKKDIWFCRGCGMTYPKTSRDPAVMGCGNSNHYLVVASLTYSELIPEPDPLRSLLIADGIEAE